MSLFSYSLIDEAGVRGTVPIFVDHATSLTQANLAAQAVVIGSMIDAITGAKIERVKVSFDVALDGGWKASAVSGIDMEQGLLMSWNIGTGPYQDAIAIGALRDTLIVDGRPVLTAAGAIDNFRQAVESQTGLTGIEIKTKLLDTLGTLVSAAVSFRNKRKQRKAVSKISNPA